MRNWTTTMSPARIFRMVRVPTLDHRTGWCSIQSNCASPNEHGYNAVVLSDGSPRKSEKPVVQAERGLFMEMISEKTMKMMNLEDPDEETARMVERTVVLRVATKHINLWIRQLEMKKNEIRELAELFGFD